MASNLPLYQEHGAALRLTLRLHSLLQPWLSAHPGVHERLYCAYKAWADRSFVRWIRRYEKLMRGGVAVEVGAGWGFYTNLLRKAVGACGHLEVFEPDPSNGDRLRRRLGSDLDRIRIHSLAVSDRQGTGELWINPAHFFDHRLVGPHLPDWSGVKLPTSVTTLDAKLGRGVDVSFLKVDVQGQETAVLKGARRVLGESRRPLVWVEYSPSYLEYQGYTPGSLKQELLCQGFRFFYQLRESGGVSVLGNWPPGKNILCTREPLR